MLSCSTDYQNNIYANSRRINGRITFTINGTSTVYDDTYITQMTILEEMSTLNDSIPSDEIQVTLDNTSGTFNFLNLSNMHQIIAQRPTIVAELGLNYVTTFGDNWSANFTGKVSGDTTANSSIAKYGRGTALLTPSGSWTSELTQTYYNEMMSVDGSLFPTGSTATSGYIPQTLFQFDVIGALTSKYGSGVWQGKTALSDKITLAQQYINSLTINWYGYGTAPTANGGNKASVAYWNGSAWTGATSHTNATVTKLTLIIPDTNIDSNGFIDILAYANTSDGTTQSIINTDYVELVITTNAFSADEWQPLGTFYLDSWKNDVGALTVTLIGHDNFTMLDNISYGAAGTGANMTLYDLAVDVFSKAGITNYNIDSSLSSYTTTTGFKEAVTCRVALQHIGIAGMVAVYQDRTGTMQIKPFASIDTASNYINYPGSQMGLYSGLDPYDTALYAKLNDGNGMKRLDLNNMWTVPEIALDKSIYQLIVKVYSDVNTSTDYSQINTDIAGQNGESFTIDNPLINTTTLAQSVASWFILESNFNVVYKSNWRGNPILEGADIVTVSNGIDTTYAKQARIYKQEFQYQGYLTCQTESRGGV